MDILENKKRNMEVGFKLNKGLPYHTEAEQCVLGSILLDPVSAISQTVGYLETDDFYNIGHKAIFEACVQLHRAGSVIDIVTLADILKNDVRMEQLGGISYLGILTERTPSASNVKYYARILKRESERRNQIVKAVGEIETAYSDEQIIPIKSSIKLAEVLEDIYEGVYSGEKADRNAGYSTGFNSLDEYFGGLHPGELYIIAGRPSMGKSAISAQIAAYVKSMGGRVIFFPLEVGKRQLAINLAAMSTKTETWKLRKGMGYSHDSREVDALMVYLSAQREGLFLLSNRKTTKGIYAAVREAIAEHGGIDIVFIDHLQEILGDVKSKFVPRHYQLETILQEIRDMAREYNIPVVLAAQVGRNAEGREPTLAEIKDSGSIEQIADVITIIHGENRGSGDRNLIVAKHRNGPTGRLSLHLEGKYLRFEDMDVKEF